MNADASAVCHGDRDLFLFSVDVYEVEGDKLFSVIELKFAQLILLGGNLIWCSNRVKQRCVHELLQTGGSV